MKTPILQVRFALVYQLSHTLFVPEMALNKNVYDPFFLCHFT